MKVQKVQKAGNTMKVCSLSLSVLLLVFGVLGCSHEKSVSQSNLPKSETYTSFVGQAGPQGQAGPVGAQGQVGVAGDPGAGIAGAVGEQGLVGPAGIQGQTGVTGPAGYVAQGRPGVTGPVGPAGAQGVRGATGQQGISTAGPDGAIGRSGPAGAQGVRGGTGDRGPTLVGPSGPAGQRGPAGPQGPAGQTGAQGAPMAGMTGLTGPDGKAGPQGPAGQTGAQGPAGVVDRWTSYRAFWFESDTSDLRDSDMDQVSEIADYMEQNPSLKVGIDGSITHSSDKDMAGRRVDTVRTALISAGVPASRIETGAFGDANLARERRVEVLLRTNYYSKN